MAFIDMGVLAHNLESVARFCVRLGCTFSNDDRSQDVSAGLDRDRAPESARAELCLLNPISWQHDPGADRLQRTLMRRGSG